MPIAKYHFPRLTGSIKNNVLVFALHQDINQKSHVEIKSSQFKPKDKSLSVSFSEITIGIAIGKKHSKRIGK